MQRGRQAAGIRICGRSARSDHPAAGGGLIPAAGTPKPRRRPWGASGGNWFPPEEAARAAHDRSAERARLLEYAAELRDRIIRLRGEK